MKKDTNEEVLNAFAAEAPETQQHSESGIAAFNDLLKNGTAVLEAPTREALAELVNTIPSDCKYAVGAVGQNFERGTYTIQVDIVKQ